jgi:hypothetical protein
MGKLMLIVDTLKQAGKSCVELHNEKSSGQFIGLIVMSH